MSEACQNCRGTGYIPNDPDLSKLQLCLTCGGTGEVDEERDFVMERAKLEADREDAEEGRQERIREQLESIFSKADQPEAWPEDRSKRSQIIGDIAEELVFGNGKEE